jgi:transcriptional regulator with XRE-family HTH domain
VSQIESGRLTPSLHTLGKIATALGVPIASIDATVTCHTDARGLLGMDDVEPDLRGMTLDVSVTSPLGAAAVDELARVWRERCPVYLALIKPTDVAVQFHSTE